MFPPYLLLLNVGGSLLLMKGTEILEVLATNSTLKALVLFLNSVFSLLYFALKVEKPLLDAEGVLHLKTQQAGIDVRVCFMQTTPCSYPGLLRPTKPPNIPQTVMKESRSCGGCSPEGKGEAEPLSNGRSRQQLPV